MAATCRLSFSGYHILCYLFLRGFRHKFLYFRLNCRSKSAWYVPFVWLALIISYLTTGLILKGLLFVALSALLIAGLYYLAVELNTRFGLYEPPAITLQKSGVYAPKSGYWVSLAFQALRRL